MNPRSRALVTFGAIMAWTVLARPRGGSKREDRPAAASTDSSSVLLEAVGVPYSYGGGYPGATWPTGSRGVGGGVGWDCSGFAQAGLVQLGQLSTDAEDRTAQGLADTGRSADGSREGDLAFYGKSWSKVSHVMLSLGNGQVIGASGGTTSTNADDSGAYVKVFNTPQYRGDFLGWKRL